MNFLLFILAVLPPVALCLIIKILGKGVKYPASVLTMLFFGGVVIGFPILVLEFFTDLFLAAAFMKASNAYFATNFYFVAVYEEGFKMLVFWFITKDRIDFDHMYDGIIYCVFASLGFATAENIMYVSNFGVEAGIKRAVLSIPCHMFFAVIMGYNFSMWKFTNQTNVFLRVFKKNGVFPASAKPLNAKKYLVCSMVLPVLAHWFYNFFLQIDEAVLFYILVIFIYIYCIVKIIIIVRKNKNFILSSREYLLSKRPELEVYYKKYQAELKAKELEKAQELASLQETVEA